MQAMQICLRLSGLAVCTAQGLMFETRRVWGTGHSDILIIGDCIYSCVRYRAEKYLKSSLNSFNCKFTQKQLFLYLMLATSTACLYLYVLHSDSQPHRSAPQQYEEFLFCKDEAEPSIHSSMHTGHTHTHTHNAGR